MRRPLGGAGDPATSGAPEAAYGRAIFLNLNINHLKLINKQRDTLPPAGMSIHQKGVEGA